MESPIINQRDVLKLTTLSRSKMYDLAKQGHFPKPVKLVGNRVVWRTGDVMDWINNTIQQGGLS
jgi:predicted DNA-binding transcriptional regulator AlpA